jgi:hypothetical protein
LGKSLPGGICWKRRPTAGGYVADAQTPKFSAESRDVCPITVIAQRLCEIYMSNHEVVTIDVDGVEDAQPKRRGGRAPGQPNHITREMRDIAKNLVEENADNLREWLATVANGRASMIVAPQPELGISGGVIPAIDPDPARAIELLVKIAEFAAPKATRVPLLGPGFGDDDEGGVRAVVNVTMKRSSGDA